jgi:hypothetical protein
MDGDDVPAVRFQQMRGHQGIDAPAHGNGDLAFHRRFIE